MMSSRDSLLAICYNIRFFKLSAIKIYLKKKCLYIVRLNKMTKFDCGCRIMTDVITRNDTKQPNWNYLLKTFVNVCGKCYKKQMKFQYMENKLMEMEKQRMEMFLENEDEEQDTYFDLTELKEHLKTLPPNERHKVKDFERLRNLANGQDPNEGMNEIDMVIGELEEEEREKKNQPELKK